MSKKGNHPNTVRTQNRIIRLLRAEGKTYEEIGEILSMDKSWVHRLSRKNSSESK